MSKNSTSNEADAIKEAVLDAVRKDLSPKEMSALEEAGFDEDTIFALYEMMQEVSSLLKESEMTPSVRKAYEDAFQKSIQSNLEKPKGKDKADG